MPNWYTDGSDTCDCTFAHTCPTHRAEQDRRDAETAGHYQQLQQDLNRLTTLTTGRMPQLDIFTQIQVQTQLYPRIRSLVRTLGRARTEAILEVLLDQAQEERS